MKIENDSFSSDGDFADFLHKAFRTASAFMEDGASYYIFHADSEGVNFRSAASEEIGKVRECLVWVKNTFVMGRQDYQWRHEPCLYGWKGSGHEFFGDRAQCTVLEFDKPARNDKHPTMKPVPLFAYLMQNSTREGQIVLDLFGGSGTTLIAAEQAKRKCYTVELDPNYCDVILARWGEFTGLKAHKIKE